MNSMGVTAEAGTTLHGCSTGGFTAVRSRLKPCPYIQARAEGRGAGHELFPFGEVREAVEEVLGVRLN